MITNDLGEIKKIVRPKAVLLYVFYHPSNFLPSLNCKFSGRLNSFIKFLASGEYVVVVILNFFSIFQIFYIPMLTIFKFFINKNVGFSQRRSLKHVSFAYKGSLSGVTPRIASNFGKR